MNYRDSDNAQRITLAMDGDEDVLVHAHCAELNPDVVPYGGDYQFEDGECCAICGADLLHEAFA